jgi:uncharacterized membrane protein (DUF485 family)
MSQTPSIDWARVSADPRFLALATRRARFLWSLMGISVVYYFLLPVGAAYALDFFRIRLFGPINVGLVFALSEFVVAWFVAFLYTRVASRRFDRLAQEIVDASFVRSGG